MMKSIYLLLLASILCEFAQAAGGGMVEGPQKPLPPANRYSGSVPIELDNGLLFNNGTFGAPNADYVRWSKAPTMAVGLSENSYPYERKTDFIESLAERIAFFEEAIVNWTETTADTKPEAQTYSQQAIDQIRPRLELAKTALGDAKGAGRAGWQKAQDDARRTLLNLIGTYRELHKNVL